MCTETIRLNPILLNEHYENYDFLLLNKAIGIVIEDDVKKYS